MRKEKTPLEEVKSVLAPLVQMTEERGHITSRSTKAKSGGEEATESSNKPSIPVRPNEYDLSDEENLSSPFLRRVERERTTLPTFGTMNSFLQCEGEEGTTSLNKPSIPVRPVECDLSDQESNSNLFMFLGRAERERIGTRRQRQRRW